MEIVLVGLNHRTAPLELRERVAELLHLDMKNVSIKGKTPEGLPQDSTAVAVGEPTR